jgi:hypothetical protein
VIENQFAGAHLIRLPKAEAFAADPSSVTDSLRTEGQLSADAARDTILDMVVKYGREHAHASAFGMLAGVIKYSQDIDQIRAALEGVEQALNKTHR